MSLADAWSKDDPIFEPYDLVPESAITEAVAAERERCALIIDSYRQTVESVMPNPVAQEFCEGQLTACKSLVKVIRGGNAARERES